MPINAEKNKNILNEFKYDAFDHKTFVRYQRNKLKLEIEYIEGIVDFFIENINHPLTIKKIKARLGDVLFALYSGMNSKEYYAIVVDSCKKRRKLLSELLFKMTGLIIHENKEGKEIITQLIHIPYQFILFNVDYFFSGIDEIIKAIRADTSKNNDTPIYLITSSKSNFEQLKIKSFDDNTFVLEPFNPKQVELILRRFEMLYVERRFFKK